VLGEDDSNMSVTIKSDFGLGSVGSSGEAEVSLCSPATTPGSGISEPPSGPEGPYHDTDSHCCTETSRDLQFAEFASSTPVPTIPSNQSSRPSGEPIHFEPAKHESVPPMLNLDMSEDRRERGGESGNNSADHKSQREVDHAAAAPLTGGLRISVQDEPAAIYHLSQVLTNLEVGVTVDLATTERCWAWIRGGHILQSGRDSRHMMMAQHKGSTVASPSRDLPGSLAYPPTPLAVL
jgi:hypothetical protein